MKSQPKISIVTAVYNSHDSIAHAIKSVISQDYSNIEHIIVDGQSTDGSDEIIAGYSENIDKYIREPDNGIYDALNKGINAATGEVVGFLHADDLLAGPTVVSEVAKQFEDEACNAVYGDLVYVDKDDSQKIIRYWKSGEFDAQRFRYGWMPPHPTFYLRRHCYQQFGGYRTDIGTAADYEMVLRLLYKERLSVSYVPQILVKMRVGGASNKSLANRLKANKSDRNAWIENGLQPPFGLRFSKPFSKIKSYFVRPQRNP